MTQRPMHIGSDWDCGSDNELQVLGQGPQPTEELIASGMPGVQLVGVPGLSCAVEGRLWPISWAFLGPLAGELECG